MQRKAAIVSTSSPSIQNTWNSRIPNQITNKVDLKFEKINKRSEAGDWRWAVGHSNFLTSIFRRCYRLGVQHRNLTDQLGYIGFDSRITRKATYSVWITSFSFEFFIVGRGDCSVWRRLKFIEIKLVMIAVYNTII
jgi:hypothetical protein